MRVTFLGTGTSQGVPIIGCECPVCLSLNEKDKRLRTSVMVQLNGKNIVVDSGPDFRQQMLRAGIRHLDGLLLTHAHKDHIAGLDDIRAFNFIQREAINVYCTGMVEEQLKREFAYIFAETKYPGIPELNLHPLEAGVAFVLGGIAVLPVEVMHYRLPVLGFKFTHPISAKTFVYITDANYISPENRAFISGCDTLVLNALRKEKHISHFTLQEALDVIKDVAPRKAYLTHISHQLGLHNEVSAQLPEGVELAYDGLTITI